MFEAQKNDVIQSVLEKKTVEFNIVRNMSLLDYYSLGYYMARSQCHWVLSMTGDGGMHEGVKMLGAGVNTMQQPSGRVVGLRGEDHELSVEAVFNEWEFHLDELSLTLHQ